ncbi:S-methyl-5-thioribose kinase [Treponema sp. HNW]|uniref:S-methyl-5-thioribose kinase n=1 Tax=Treponema sp. HNW TaxID=3116654 RepID=UPI003D0B3C9A
MSKDYSKHFLMTPDDVKIYVMHRGFFDSNAHLVCSEIGDGNINYVFKVIDEKTNKSLVIKQADKLLRSSGRPLDLHRSKIEAEILRIEGSLAPSMVPKVYLYDDALCALVMEDISSYKNLRTQMLEGHTFSHFAENISDFLAATLIPTTDLVIGRAEKKEKVKLFTNIELCDITEDLVLTEPYYDYKKRNRITKGNKDFVETHLYRNEALKAQAGMLRNAFMNEAQALIHGDLHSGSIFINEKGIKVIDPEFAFYGPMGYDIGNVIGNMFFALAHKSFCESENKTFISWAEQCIADIVDLTEAKLAKKYDECVSFPLYTGEFKKSYLARVKADSLGFAGTEIIRRVVGDTKVKELSSVKDGAVKIRMERALILTGENLIMNRHKNLSGKNIVNLFKKAQKEVTE